MSGISAAFLFMFLFRGLAPDWFDFPSVSSSRPLPHRDRFVVSASVVYSSGLHFLPLLLLLLGRGLGFGLGLELGLGPGLVLCPGCSLGLGLGPDPDPGLGLDLVLGLGHGFGIDFGYGLGLDLDLGSGLGPGHDPYFGLWACSWSWLAWVVCLLFMSFVRWCW